MSRMSFVEKANPDMPLVLDIEEANNRSGPVSRTSRINNADTHSSPLSRTSLTKKANSQSGPLSLTSRIEEDITWIV